MISPRWSLALLGALASLVLAIAQPAAAAAPDVDAALVQARTLYGQGRAVTAREGLARRLAAPDLAPPDRVRLLEALLDLCLDARSDGCIATYAPQYAAAAEPVAKAADGMVAEELARRAAFYLDAARYGEGSHDLTASLLDGDFWQHEIPQNAWLYLRRQVLAANILLALDRRVEADAAVDRILSLLAALKGPVEDPGLVAYGLTEAMGVLVEIGETERAYGLWRAAGRPVLRALPPLSVDAVLLQLTAAQAQQEMGDLRAARALLQSLLPVLDRIELDDDTRAWMRSAASVQLAAVCVALQDVPCARDALARHPSAARYASAAPSPASAEDLTYLAARALTAALSGGDDPVAAAALKAPVDLTWQASYRDQLEVYRVGGAALALPRGPGRQAGLAAMGARLVQAAARRPAGPLGAWWRPGAIDRLLIGVALTQADRLDPATAFELFQLDARLGPSFDADALALLSQATDETQRRDIHEALRLRARRDRVERAQIQVMAGRLTAGAGGGAPLAYDPAMRLAHAALARRLEAARLSLAKAGIGSSGAQLVPLKRLQAALAPNEAALAAAVIPGGLAHLCVRHDAVTRSLGPVDLARMSLDMRLVQAALTDGQAPSEALDSQFPVASAVRLHEELIGPAQGCLRPGDHLIWLASAARFPIPLSVLLAQAPPRLGEGYDLAQADWLMRRHAISYAGSAALLVATRTAVGRPAADLDFLGVGDPLLTGRTPSGEDRAAILARGARGDVGLAPLPETRDELARSAAGFASARALVGADATERALRSQPLGAYRFLSFATHGLLRDDLQGLAEPALVLTPVTAADAADDGLLTASEVADLNLSARFVALSACNTANYDLAQLSQDLPALASAFAVAGVPATLATLWPVNSRTSQEVVAQAFAVLRADPALGPAEALARAQRAFLAAPPGRAYLHPRFWAPFVLLGDGGSGPPPRPSALRLASVETLTKAGGEVIGLAPSGPTLGARMIAERDAAGRFGSGLRLADAQGRQAWRMDSREFAALAPLLPFEGGWLAAGYRWTEPGRAKPALEAFAPDGARRGTWQGEAALDGFVAAAATVQGRPLVAVVETDLRREAGPSRLRVLEIRPGLAAAARFEITAPAGTWIGAATLTPLGDTLVVTYSDAVARPVAKPAFDEFETELCHPGPTTWIEARDARTGALKASRTLAGYEVVAAAPAGAGRVVLAGSVAAGCADGPRAVVLSLDARLQPTPVYQDTGLGWSEARAVAAAGAGRLLVAGWRGDPLDPAARTSGLLVLLDPRSRTPTLRLLDAGANLQLSSAAALGDRLWAGGALGGEAALLGLAAP